MAFFFFFFFFFFNSLSNEIPRTLCLISGSHRLREQPCLTQLVCVYLGTCSDLGIWLRGGGGACMGDNVYQYLSLNLLDGLTLSVLKHTSLFFILKGHRKSVIFGWSLTTVLLKFSKTSSRSDHLSELSFKKDQKSVRFLPCHSPET